jgi:hypothetical protein
MSRTVTDQNLAREHASLCFDYPFPAGQCFLNFNNQYHESLERYLASLACFGQQQLEGRGLFVNEDEILTKEDLERSLRILSNSMIPDDFSALDNLPILSKNKKSLLKPLDLLNQSEQNLSRELSNLRRYDQAIFPHCILPNKWIIYVAVLPTGTLQGYFIGSTTATDILPTCNKLLSVLGQLVPGKHFSFEPRLFVPSSFVQDHVLIASFFQAFLQNRYKYLSCTQETVELFRLHTLRKIRAAHDTWLGLLPMLDEKESPYPFIAERKGMIQIEIPPEGLPYKLPNGDTELIQKGWTVLDVTGDGNCFYYSLILGLENCGKIQLTTNNIGDKGGDMTKSVHWQKEVLTLRKQLLRQSKHLLERIYPPGNRNHEWWLNTGVDSDDCESLSDEFVDKGRKRSRYFDWQLDEEFRTNPYWAPMVAASLFELRLVVVFRTVQSLPLDNGRFSVSVECTTAIFEYNAPTDTEDEPHIKFTQHDNLVRIPHEDWKRKPTIEIVFDSGYLPPTEADKKEHFANPENKDKTVPNRNLDQHFQFLRL